MVAPSVAVVCARLAKKAGRSATWQVVPNHPACTCCPTHKCRLVEAIAIFDLRLLHDPGLWIRHDIPDPEIASPEEVSVALDLQWLYDQKSKYLPGYRRVAATLRDALLQNPDYRQHGKALHVRALRRDLMERMPTALEKLDPKLFAEDCPEGRALLPKQRDSLQRYSILAQLAGWNFKRLFEEAARRDHGSDPKCIVFQRHAPEVIQRHRETLTDAIHRNPEFSRCELLAVCGKTLEIIRRKDRKFYETVMPASIRGKYGGNKPRPYPRHRNANG